MTEKQDTTSLANDLFTGPGARLFQVLNRRFNLLEAANIRDFRQTALLIFI